MKQDKIPGLFPKYLHYVKATGLQSVNICWDIRATSILMILKIWKPILAQHLNVKISTQIYKQLCKIWGCQGSDYEKYCVLGGMWCSLLDCYRGHIQENNTLQLPTSVPFVPDAIVYNELNFYTLTEMSSFFVVTLYESGI